MKTSVFLAVAVASLLCSLLSAKRENYNRTVHYYDQLVIKCELTDNFKQTLQEQDFVDPWGLDEEKRLHVRISVQRWSALQRLLPECSVAIENVEEYVQRGEKEAFNTSRPGASWFEEYHQYKEIVQWYQDLVNNYPTISKYVDSIGKSIEGRDLPAVHFTSSNNPEYTVYLQCQIHAREWISGAVCMYVANYLCENYGKDMQVTKLMDKLQFVFVPVVNPDGYEYTWTNDRLWRKNLRVNSGSSCLGVDLNRNYNDHWNEGGSSSNPCSETYHGISAASEPETQHTQAYFETQNKVIAGIDWHSYSQLILRPYGWTRSPSPDEELLRAIGDEMSEEIFGVHGMRYTSQTSADLYIASGGASDWFYGEDATSHNEGIRAAGYTIELRDTGRYGFELPPDQIIPSGQEVVPAVLFLAETMLENPIVSGYTVTQ